MDEEIVKQLEERLGRVHARQRLGIEAESGHKVFGGGINFFHPENWYSIHSLIKNIIKMSGMYRRGKRNARNIQVIHNEVPINKLPEVFDGYTLLHLTDLHVDMSRKNMDALVNVVRTLEYDLCVITGDYRAGTYGDFDVSIQEMERLMKVISAPAYGVLGNHDSIGMVPALEALGLIMLLNESVRLEKGGHAIYLAGIDDAHYFQVDNIQKSAEDIPQSDVSVMLSHTPETYRQVAHADFDLMLCGHTHGGQICLPGGIPVYLDSGCPRFVGKGSWSFHGMLGYTSVGAGTSMVNVRFNCLPEVTLHTLKRATES